MNDSASTQARKCRWRTVLIVAVATLLALPFLLGMCSIGRQLLTLPRTANVLIRAEMIESFYFTLGFALGIWGTVLSFCCGPRSHRLLATAITIAGCGHIAFGFSSSQLLRTHSVDITSGIISIAVPALLWLLAVITIMKAVRLQKSENTTEAQQQPQSQP
ncbi:MAG: hypothetical protein ABFD54_17730 [Armatimonadota bacterium]|nr:hypothetical protein [bacterium]